MTESISNDLRSKRPPHPSAGCLAAICFGVGMAVLVAVLLAMIGLLVGLAVKVFEIVAK